MFSAFNMFKAAVSLLVLWFCFHAGQKYERSDWQAHEIKQIAEAAKKLEKLHDEARAKESLASVELSNIQSELSEAQNEINAKENTINQQRDAIASLRWGASAMQSSGSEAGAVAASTEICNGEERTIFSRELFEAIYTEFGKADAVVEQLTACQEVIELDRRIVNDE